MFAFKQNEILLRRITVATESCLKRRRGRRNRALVRYLYLFFILMLLVRTVSHHCIKHKFQYCSFPSANCCPLQNVLQFCQWLEIRASSDFNKKKKERSHWGIIVLQYIGLVTLLVYSIHCIHKINLFYGLKLFSSIWRAKIALLISVDMTR